MASDYRILDISPAAFEEIKVRLQACGAASQDVGNITEIELNQGFRLRRETDERVKVWLTFNGKKFADNDPKPNQEKS